VSGALPRAIAGQPADSLAVGLAFGLVLVALVAALGHVSGAHFNPAVTLALAATGKFPWRYAPAYLVSQLVGAVLASLAVWATYGSPARATAALGATIPATSASTIQVLLIEALITFLLVLVIVSVATDDRVPAAAVGPAVGFALAAAVLIGGPVSGGAVNPARALGPMIVSGTFTDWWAYIVGPVAGAIIAAVVYDRFSPTPAPPNPPPPPASRTPGPEPSPWTTGSPGVGPTGSTPPPPPATRRSPVPGRTVGPGRPDRDPPDRDPPDRDPPERDPPERDPPERDPPERDPPDRAPRRPRRRAGAAVWLAVSGPG